MRPYYEGGGITIYHGDCAEILPSLPEIDLVLTDPPYGIAWGSTLTKWRERSKQMTEQWDLERPTELVLLLATLAPRVVIWGGNFYPLPISRAWLCWYKPDSALTFGQFELAWTNCD